MKATGIIRRIDDLGRVVIPKELRRTLNIQVGDSLEIFTHEDTIIFRKYSPIDSMRQNAQTYAEALYEVLQSTVVVCDRDFALSVCGPDEKEILGRRVSNELHQAEPAIAAGNNGYAVKAFEGIDKYVLAGTVIENPNGDRCGYLLLLTENPSREANEAERFSLAVGAEYLGRQITI